MWYVVCTRARDLLVVPNLPTSRAASWYRAVRLDKLELTEINLDGLPERVAEDRPVEVNLQSAEKFAEQAAVVAMSAPKLTWRQPSLGEADRVPLLADMPPSTELTQPRQLPVGAGPLRGTLLHKLTEEVFSGDLPCNLEVLRDRAEKLLGQLISKLPGAEMEMPDPTQVAACVRDIFSIGEVANVLPFLEAEVPVWHKDGQTLLAGRVDALIVREGKVLGVLDWKSDVMPSTDAKSQYVAQVAGYLAITGAVAGAVVFMTTGELMWIGDRDALLAQLAGAPSDEPRSG
jgi:hypothetical protein